MDSDETRRSQALRIRVTLELSRSDDPLLFDALVQLKKGRRRVARLRTSIARVTARYMACSPTIRRRGRQRPLGGIHAAFKRKCR